MDKIAKRLRNVQEMNKTQAIRSARTIVTGAENKGRQDSYARAEADGIILQKEWLATNDGRTRHSHAVLDGAIVDQDKKFDNGLMYPGDPSGRPEEVYNCFVGETKVASDSDVVRSYKHKYDGKIISIKTAGGVQFSCTPNHPILTPNGWVAAELLNNGNNILVTFGENNVFSRVDPNVNHRFPRIDTIHKFGKKFRSKRTSCLGVDFHGDVATSNVEIITHKRLLGDVRNSSGRNGVDKFLFKLSNKTLSCFGPLFKHFWSVCKTSFCFIGCKCKSLPFFKCSVGHSCEHGFGTIANRDSVLTEYSINDLPADTVIDGELLDRLSCKVFLDTIVNVDVSVLSTHVYNLQTENGYYFVNSIVPQDAEKSNGIFAIAKNCRCTLVAKVNGFKKVQVQKAMAEKQEEFVPAKTKKEAEQYATRFADEVSYSGISVENCNEINKTLNELQRKYPSKKYSKIVGKKQKATASANYEILTINGSKIGSKEGAETFETMRRWDQYTLETLRAKYPGKMPPDVAKKVEKLEQNLRFDRWSISHTYGARATITHEYAHTLSDQYFGMINDTVANPNARSAECLAIKRKIDETRKKAWETGDIFSVSKYAATDDDEFFAEVFSMREMGEKIPDYFDEMLEEALKNGIM
jgi:hypothetical protein